MIVLLYLFNSIIPVSPMCSRAPGHWAVFWVTQHFMIFVSWRDKGREGAAVLILARWDRHLLHCKSEGFPIAELSG